MYSVNRFLPATRFSRNPCLPFSLEACFLLTPSDTCHQRWSPERGCGRQVIAEVFSTAYSGVGGDRQPRTSPVLCDFGLLVLCGGTALRENQVHLLSWTDRRCQAWVDFGAVAPIDYKEAEPSTRGRSWVHGEGPSTGGGAKCKGRVSALRHFTILYHHQRVLAAFTHITRFLASRPPERQP